jgi:hypothetical protein
VGGRKRHLAADVTLVIRYLPDCVERIVSVETFLGREIKDQNWGGGVSLFLPASSSLCASIVECTVVRLHHRGWWGASHICCTWDNSNTSSGFRLCADILCRYSLNCGYYLVRRTADMRNSNNVLHLGPGNMGKCSGHSAPH